MVESHPAYHHLLALLPAAKLEAIAAWPGIRFIGPRQEATTAGPRTGLAAGLKEALQAAAVAAAATFDPEGDCRPTRRPWPGGCSTWTAPA